MKTLVYIQTKRMQKKSLSNHIQKKKKKKKYAKFDGSFSAFCLKWNEIDDERISIQNEILW